VKFKTFIVPLSC